MERTEFFLTTTVNGVSEYDHLHNNLSKFKMSYPVQYYRVLQDDVMRPDLISYKNYGSIQYWWIICYINDIQDPLTDIVVGDLLTLPSIIDIYSFYKKYRIT